MVIKSGGGFGTIRMSHGFLKKRTLFFGERETVTNIGTFPHLIFFAESREKQRKKEIIKENFYSVLILTIIFFLYCIGIQNSYKTGWNSL